MSEKGAMAKTKKGTPNTGPVRNRGPQKAKGNPTKSGEVFGKRQKSLKSNGGK